MFSWVTKKTMVRDYGLTMHPFPLTMVFKKRVFDVGDHELEKNMVWGEPWFMAKSILGLNHKLNYDHKPWLSWLH